MNNDDFKCRFIEEELKTFWPQWHVARRLGGGAIGDVFEIYRDNLEVRELSALKLIRISDTGEAYAPFPSAEGAEPYRMQAGQQVIPEVFRYEIQIMEALQGAPNIVSIDDYYLKKDASSTMLFVRMELLTGFRQLLAERQRKHQAFTIPEVLKIGRDICSALIYCEEEGIIHRDIKPANLFIDDFGNYKVGDFGVSGLLDTARVAPSMTGIETISYMAPEVFSGLPYNNTVDIYALGLILYQLLNNCRVPFLPTEGPCTAKDIDSANYRRLHGEAIPSLEGIRAGDRAVDAALDAMIRKACAVRPEDRYQSAQAFYEDLAAWGTPQKAVLPMDDKQSRTTPGSFISDSQDAGPSRGSTYSYRKAEEPVPKYPPKSDGRNFGNGQKKGGPGKGAVLALILVALLALGGYIIMRGLHVTQSSSSSDSLASSDPAYKEETVIEESVKEETGKEESVKEEAGKEETGKEEAGKEETGKEEAGKEESVIEESVKEESVKEEAGKEETYKEGKESDSAENDMAQEDTRPVGESAEIVEIPDPVLKKAIQDTLGIGDREITKSDALLLTQLEYVGYDNEKKEHKDQIKDITGLEAFKNLASLNLTSNQISDLSVLSDMTNLTELYLDDNQISDLSPLSGLTNLTKLWMGKNRIGDISALSGLTNMDQLCLYVNWISDISALSGMTGLTRLDLSNNQVSDINALSGLTNLERLYMKINQVSDISVLSELKNLQRLGLEYNQISDISALAGLTKLETLRLYSNPVLDNKSREEILEIVSGAENLTEVDF